MSVKRFQRWLDNAVFYLSDAVVLIRVYFDMLTSLNWLAVVTISRRSRRCRFLTVPEHRVSADWWVIAYDAVARRVKPVTEIIIFASPAWKLMAKNEIRQLLKRFFFLCNHLRHPLYNSTFSAPMKIALDP